MLNSQRKEGDKSGGATDQSRTPHPQYHPVKVRGRSVASAKNSPMIKVPSLCSSLESLNQDTFAGVSGHT